MMEGCLGKKSERRGLALICICGFLFFVITSVVFGCSSAPVIPCDPVPKCPPSYVELWNASEDAADRLEDALSKAEGESQACVRVFEDSLRKSR